MTVATTTNRVQYTGNGATTEFSYPYPVQAAGDLVVVETVTATGVETVQTLTTDYTVAIAGDGASATVTAVTAPASTVTWTIYRDPALTQSTDWVNNDPLDADTLETAIDKLTMVDQRNRELVTRALRQPDGDVATIGALPAKVSRASKALTFDANGDPAATAFGSLSTAFDVTITGGDAGLPIKVNAGETALEINGALGVAGGGTGGTTAVTARQGLLLDKKGADIASASTIDLDAATGDLVDVTGTTAITAITLAEGVEKVVRFTGALTLTHGASLVLPGAANITTAAGDFAVFRGYASSVVRCVGYTKADGQPIVPGVGADLTAIEALSGTGFAVRTATDTWAQRTITGSARVSVTNGDGVAGAPTLDIASASVGQTYLASASVGQGQLKTTTGEVSLASGNSATNLTLPGGSYGFYPQVRVTTNTADAAQIYKSLTGTSYATIINIDTITMGSGDAYAQQRYVTASPPYDLGDGEIPLFVFALINRSTGLVEATYAAPEAPWHYNGPTRIVTDFTDDAGQRFRKMADSGAAANALKNASTASAREAAFDAMLVPPQFQLLTQAVKNADMPLVPHPFPGFNSATHAVVMLDPVSPLAAKLSWFYAGWNDDPEKAAFLMHNDYLRPDNEALPRGGPPGVLVVSGRWR